MAGILLSAIIIGIPLTVRAEAPVTQATFAQSPTAEVHPPMTSAEGEGEGAPATTATSNLDPGLLPAAAAVFPGILVHGAGHWVGGDGEGARKLLRWEGLGAAMFFGGVIPIGLSGASRQIIRPAYYLAATGFGIMALTWFADIYGASTGGRDEARGLTVRPQWGSEAGFVWIYDPQFDYRGFFHAAAPFSIGRFGIQPEAWVSMQTPHNMLRGEATWRFLGPLADYRSVDDSSLDLVLALSRWDYTPDGFNVLTGDIAMRGRYDMARFHETLAGSFVEAELGWGLEFFDFHAPGYHAGDEAAALLLARFGYGVRFGTPPVGHGEVVAFYDHRHDDFLAGSGFGGLGDGVLGHWGLEGRWFFHEEWGLSAEVAQGSAWMGRLALVYRGGIETGNL